MAGNPKRRALTGEPPKPGARSYSWAPFQPGHTLSVHHGARSPRIVGEVAEQLAVGLVEDRPDLLAYPEAVGAWARAEARCWLVESFIAENGLLDADGKPVGVAKYVAGWERLAVELRATLGLDPKSEAALARERAGATPAVVDLEGLRERGRAALDAAATDHVEDEGETETGVEP
jgi:hypothetical protein